MPRPARLPRGPAHAANPVGDLPGPAICTRWRPLHAQAGTLLSSGSLTTSAGGGRGGEQSGVPRRRGCCSRCHPLGWPVFCDLQGVLCSPGCLSGKHTWAPALPDTGRRKHTETRPAFSCPGTQALPEKTEVLFPGSPLEDAPSRPSKEGSWS